MTSTEPGYVPATHVEPPPGDGWRAADLSPDEYVDDAFIQEAARRTYAPLQPEDERLFPIRRSDA